MKKTIIVSVICVVVLSLCMVFWYCHPTHYKYNDRFVLGKSAEEITDRYGEFSRKWTNDKGEVTCGFYMIREDRPGPFMGYDDSLWYEIHFRDGIAVEVRLQEGWYGG